jgi:hypothetical protein
MMLAHFAPLMPAKALHTTGMLLFGYSYVNFDDWYATHNEEGNLKADNKTFPMAWSH